MPEWAIFIGVVALVGFLAFAFAVGMDQAVQRSRAWRLWEAGLIDDDELLRRIGN